MPFNYQTLKNLNSNSFVANTLTGADLAANAVTTTNLQNIAITGQELATGSVNLAGTKVSGTIPATSGGTGLTGFAGANLLFCLLYTSDAADE